MSDDPEAPGEGVQPPSDRMKVRRLPERGRYDRATIDAILDAAFVGHVAYIIDGQPFVTPTSVWRQGDRIYWHGSSASRMLRQTRDGAPVCVTVTLLDGLVLARSGFDHSIDYRSVMIVGTARAVTDANEQLVALEAFTEHLYPGRWAELRPATRQELKATTVLWTTISEASAKLRTGGPHDEPGDETWPTWAGHIPVRTVLEAPRPDAFVPDGWAPPAVSRAVFPHQGARPDGIRIRRVHAGEADMLAPVLTDLCRRSKAHWGYPAELMQRWAADLTITPQVIVRDSVVVAQDEGHIVGFAHVARRADHAQLVNLWLEPTHIGTGLGRRLWDAAVAIARTLPYAEMRFAADPHAEPFYTHMGARRVGDVPSEVVEGRTLGLWAFDLQAEPAAAT